MMREIVDAIRDGMCRVHGHAWKIHEAHAIGGETGRITVRCGRCNRSDQVRDKFSNKMVRPQNKWTGVS